MKKIVFGMALVLAALLAAACSTITLPVAVTGNPVGDKTGESTATAVIIPYALYGSGSIGYADAAANGGITRIATIEKRIRRTPFGVTTTIIVNGD